MTLSPRPVHVSAEVHGVTVEHGPIPWNASNVRVEVLLNRPAADARDANRYTLTIEGRPPIPAESLGPVDSAEDDRRYRLIFRLPHPGPEVTSAKVSYRGHRLIEVPLVHLTREAFLAELRLSPPTFWARLGEQLVPARTLPNGRWKGGVATAHLRSPVPLAPLLDLGVSLKLRGRRSGARPEDPWDRELPVTLVPTLLAGRDTTLAVELSRQGETEGEWQLGWFLGDRLTETVRLRSVGRVEAGHAVHVTFARFAIERPDGRIEIVPHLTGVGDYSRVGPCFVVVSRLDGFAGRAKLLVTAKLNRPGPSPQLFEEEVLLTDGPTPLTTGWLTREEVEQISLFELRLGRRIVHRLTPQAAPKAVFNAEGGFVPAPDFSWSAAAEAELNEGFARLLNAPRG